MNEWLNETDFGQGPLDEPFPLDDLNLRPMDGSAAVKSFWAAETNPSGHDQQHQQLQPQADDTTAMKHAPVDQMPTGNTQGEWAMGVPQQPTAQHFSPWPTAALTEQLAHQVSVVQGVMQVVQQQAAHQQASVQQQLLQQNHALQQAAAAQQQQAHVRGENTTGPSRGSADSSISQITNSAFYQQARLQQVAPPNPLSNVQRFAVPFAPISGGYPTLLPTFGQTPMEAAMSAVPHAPVPVLEVDPANAVGARQVPSFAPASNAQQQLDLLMLGTHGQPQRRSEDSVMSHIPPPNQPDAAPYSALNRSSAEQQAALQQIGRDAAYSAFAPWAPVKTAPAPHQPDGGFGGDGVGQLQGNWPGQGQYPPMAWPGVGITLHGMGGGVKQEAVDQGQGGEEGAGVGVRARQAQMLMPPPAPPGRVSLDSSNGGGSVRPPVSCSQGKRVSFESIGRAGGRLKQSAAVKEKQRRDRFSSLISRLRDIVPPSSDGPANTHSNQYCTDQRPKNVVLVDAINYIEQLQGGKQGSKLVAEVLASEHASSPRESDSSMPPAAQPKRNQISPSSSAGLNDKLLVPHVSVTDAPSSQLHVHLTCPNTRNLLADVTSGLASLGLLVRSCNVRTVERQLGPSMGVIDIKVGMDVGTDVAALKEPAKRCVEAFLEGQDPKGSSHT